MYGQCPQRSVPTAKPGPGEEGAAARVSPPVGSHPGHEATSPLLDLWTPQVRVGAVHPRQERVPQQQTLGVRPAKPGSFRRPLAQLPVQLVLPHTQSSVPSRHDLPHLGPSSQAESRGAGRRCSGGGQGARSSLRGGGPTLREWSQSSLWPSAHSAQGRARLPTGVIQCHPDLHRPCR